MTTADRDLAQAPLRAPTVFNFFEPAYVLPGVIAAAGLFRQSNLAGRGAPTQRPSVVGKCTSNICIAANFSRTARGISPGAARRLAERDVRFIQLYHPGWCHICMATCHGKRTYMGVSCPA